MNRDHKPRRLEPPHLLHQIHHIQRLRIIRQPHILRLVSMSTSLEDNSPECIGSGRLGVIGNGPCLLFQNFRESEEHLRSGRVRGKGSSASASFRIFGLAHESDAFSLFESVLDPGQGELLGELSGEKRGVQQLVGGLAGHVVVGSATMPRCVLILSE